MAKISEVHSPWEQYKPNGKLVMLPLIMLAVGVICRPAQAETSIYVFDPNQSTVTQTGGFAGVNKVYFVTGQFRLSVDSDAGIALFEIVDANLADQTGAEYGRSLNDIFNMTGLAGTVIGDTTIEFEGKATDDTQSDVNLTLTFSDGSAHLSGQYTPPPNSADMFFYDINAVATRKYAGGTGEPNDPYLISTAGQLNAIGAEPDDWDKHFKLTADINLQEYSGEQFNIIGTMRDKFVGSFDGAGFTISNFKYSTGNRNFIGLFSQVGDGAQIRDVMLDNVEIEIEKGTSIGALVGFNFRGIISSCYVSGGVIGGEGSGNLGALVGFNSWGTVSNCSASGSITGLNNVSSIGGLVGNNAHGDIYDCSATTTVSGGPGSSDIGGLVGYSEAGTISNSFAAGNVSGDTSLGGLVGYKNDGSIIQCYAIGDVGGNTRLGGLVGRNDSGIINDCYATGSIDGDDALGGLVGRNHKGSVSYCYAAGTVNGSSRLGGLVGNEDRGSYLSSFWDTEANPNLTGAGDIDPDPNNIFGRTEVELKITSTFLEAGWDFVDETENGSEDIWKIAEGLSYPHLSWQKYSGGNGTAEYPYQITTAEDLMLLGETPEDYDKHFILTDNIDLDPNLPSRKIFDKAVIAPDTNDTRDYFEGVPFSGAFDGNNHTISNLHIKGGDYVGFLGLFGQLNPGATVSNLGLEAVDVNGTGDYIGGLVGKNDGSIAMSYSTGKVSGWYFSDEVGGLVGLNYGTIAMSYSIGKVTGSWNVGGLAGSNSGNITKSHTIGTVNGDFQIGGLVGVNGVGTVTECYSNSTVSGNAGVGGLVGLNWKEITMSYSTGTATADMTVGGFVGLNVGIITTSYSTSIVTGNVETGGLVGQNGVNIPTRERDGSIINCYSTGAVTGDWAVGGLVGANRLGNVDMSYSTGVVTDTDPNSLSPPTPPDDPFDPIYKGAGGLVGGNISNLASCFWDTESSGQTTSDGGTGKTTAEMQTAGTFIEAGWDFVGETENGTEDIWWILEGQDYPKLWWERAD